MTRIGLMFLFFLAQVAHARIDVVVAPREIALGQSIAVTLTSTRSEPKLDEINLTPLAGDFAIAEQAYAASDSDSGPAQTFELRLTPLRPGSVSVPALRIGAEKTAAQTINVVAGSTDFPRILIASGFAERRIFERGEATLYLDLYDDGTLQWRPPSVRALDFVLRPLPTQERQVNVQGKTYRVTRWRWGAVPLQSLPTAIQFDLIEATRFGERLAFRAPAALAQVYGVPSYLPVSLHVGELALVRSKVTGELRVGRPAVRETEIRGRGLSVSGLRRMIRFPASGDAIHYYRPELSLITHADGTQLVHIKEAFKPLREGALALQGYAVPYLDPARSLIRNLHVPSETVRAIDPVRQLSRMLSALLVLMLVAGGLIWVNRARISAWRARRNLIRAVARSETAQEALRHLYLNREMVGDPAHLDVITRLEALIYGSNAYDAAVYIKLRDELGATLRAKRVLRHKPKPHEIVFQPIRRKRAVHRSSRSA